MLTPPPGTDVMLPAWTGQSGDRRNPRWDRGPQPLWRVSASGRRRSGLGSIPPGFATPPWDGRRHGMGAGMGWGAGIGRLVGISAFNARGPAGAGLAAAGTFLFACVTAQMRVQERRSVSGPALHRR
jgi:hypothetical protein